MGGMPRHARTILLLSPRHPVLLSVRFCCYRRVIPCSYAYDSAAIAAPSRAPVCTILLPSPRHPVLLEILTDPERAAQAHAFLAFLCGSTWGNDVSPVRVRGLSWAPCCAFDRDP